MTQQRKNVRGTITAMWIAVFLTSFIPQGALAQDKPPPLASVAAVVDEQTLFIIRVDLTRFDPAAAEIWALDVMKNAAVAGDQGAIAKGVAQARAAAEAWISKFRKAGGSELHLVYGMTELATKGEPVVVVPLQPGADAAALGDMLKIGAPPERIGDSLVIATQERMDRIKATKPLQRPDLAKALASAGDGVIAIGLAASADARRAIEELAPKLPAELGGMPGGVVTQGILWASLSVQAPPQPSLKLVIQSKDADAAKALLDLMEQAKALALKAMNARTGRSPDAPPAQAETFTLAMVRMMDAATPRQRGDQLALSLGSEELGRLVGLAMSGPIQRQRQAASRVKSASNMRQLALACLVWAGERKGAWPDDLRAAVKEQTGDEFAVKSLMENPVKPGTGYVYAKPPAGVENPAERIVLYEAEATGLGGEGGDTKDAGRNVAFMDGHVEFWMEGAFQEKLKAQEAGAEAAGNRPPTRDAKR